MDEVTDQLCPQRGSHSEHNIISCCNGVVKQHVDKRNDEPVEGNENNHQGVDLELEMVETDEEEEEEEVEEITIIELSDTEIRDTDEEDDSEEEEEVVIKQEPVDDFAEGQGQEFVDFDPGQLGVIVTETELPDDLIGEPVNGMYKCKFCPAKFKSRSRLIAHIERHINNGAIRKCRFCDFFTAMTQTLREHECKHTKEKPNQCPICGFRCRLKGDLARHQETHTDRKRYHCNECGHRTRTAGNLKKHMERHQPDLPRNFVCPLCNSAFKRESALKNHLKRRHNDNKPFFCSQCSFCCKTMWELNSHKAKHSDDHPFPCTWPGCTKKFKTKSDCSKHIKRHTGIKNHTCSICGKRFFNATLLRKHLATHSDERNFECAQCMKKFKTLRALKGHTLTHQTIKPFPCTVCFKTYATQFNLDMHMHVHERGRPYQCPICVHGSREMEHLMAHMGSEHLHNFTYVCCLCRKPFGKSFQLQLHMQRCHKAEMRGKEEKMVYDPEYLDCDFQPEPSGAFDPSTFAKYLASDTIKALGSNQSAGAGITVKQEPGLGDSSDGELSSASANPPGKDSGLPDNLQLPPVVQVSRYGGIPFCLARRNSGIQLNCQKKGKKPKRWFMDVSLMTEADAEKHKEYLRKKELGLLPYTYQRRRKNKTNKGRKTSGKPKSSVSGKAKGKRKRRRMCWTVSEEDSEEEDTCYIAQQLVGRLKNEGTGNQGMVESERTSSRGRKPIVHFKNLPPNSCFDGTGKTACIKKKTKKMEDSEADLSVLQSSTPLYVGGRAANRKQNKQILNKKPQKKLAKPQKKLAKPTKKLPKQNVFLSKQNRVKPNTSVRSGLGKRMKKGIENSWALALAGPLPVSHYKAEETALNTLCWLNAVRSAATRGRFGVTRSWDEEDAASSSQTSKSGDMREEFFSRFLQLKVRTPRDDTTDNLLTQSGICTGILKENTICEEDLSTQEIVPEVKDCMEDTGGGSSATEVKVHEDQQSHSAEDFLNTSNWQAAAETICVEQDDHHVPLARSQEYSVEISSRSTMEGDTTSLSQSVMIDEANSVQQLQPTVEFTCTEHSAALEQGSADSSPKNNQNEAWLKNVKDSYLSALQPEEKVDIAVEGGGNNQSCMKSKQSMNDSSEEIFPKDAQSEVNVVISNIGVEFTHGRENGHGKVSIMKNMACDGCTPAVSQHNVNMEVNQNIHHSQDESDLLSSSNSWQNCHEHKSPMFNNGQLGGSGREQQPESLDTKDACLTGLQSQEKSVLEKSDEAEMLSGKIIIQKESRADSVFEENVRQKQSHIDGVSPRLESCGAELHLKKSGTLHGLRLQSDDIAVEEKNCAADSQLQEAGIITEKCEITSQSEEIVSSQDESLSTERPSITTNRDLEADHVDPKKLEEINKEVKPPMTVCTTHAPQNLDGKDSEVPPPSLNSCAENIGSEEIVHSAMTEVSADEQSVVKNTGQLTKCLHVLVSDVHSNPCTPDYLHSLGVNKVSLGVHPVSALHQNKTSLRHCSQKTMKPKTGQKPKRSVSKAIKPSKDKTEKAKIQTLKQVKGKVRLIKPPTTKTEKKKYQKSNVKEPLKHRALDLAGQDSGSTGIGAFLLATAVAAKQNKSPAKISTKPSPSKQKKSAGKALPKNVKKVCPQKGKSSSKVKRLSSKVKKLPSQNMSQKKSTKQLSGGKNQTGIKKNVVKGLRYVKGMSGGSNSAVAIKLEVEELHDASFCDAKTLGQGLDAGAGIPVNNQSCATVGYFSISERVTLQNISSNSHISHKKVTTAETVLSQESNTERECTANTPMTLTAKKLPKSTSKKKKTSKSSTKSHEPKQILFTDSNCNEDTQMTQNTAAGSQNSVPETGMHSSDYHPAARKMSVDVDMSGHPSSSSQLLGASETETPAYEEQEYGIMGNAKLVDTKPLSLADAGGSVLSFSSNRSIPVDEDHIISGQGLKLPTTTSCSQGNFSDTVFHPKVEEISNVSGSNATFPEASVENVVKPKKRGRPPKNKLTESVTSSVSTGSNPGFSPTKTVRQHSRCTKKQLRSVKRLQENKMKNNTAVKKTSTGKVSKASSRAHTQPWASIRQAQSGFAKPRVKATIQKKVHGPAASAIKEESKHNADKIVKPNRTTKNQSTHICKEDVARKRKRFMYVETDTGELPDPPARKRGRPPGPKIILDRSQANLCFDSPQSSTEIEQAGVCGTTDAACFGEEVPSLMLPGTLLPSKTVGEASGVCEKSEAQFSNTMLPPQFAQSMPPGNASALPLSEKVCPIQMSTGQLTDYPSSQLVSSEALDIKPIVSEMGECTVPDVKPHMREFSMMNQSVTTQFMPTEEHDPGAFWTTEQPLPGVTESSTPKASMGEIDDARAALLHALTSHFDIPESGPSDSHLISQMSLSSSHSHVKPALSVSLARGRRKKSTDPTFCVQPRYKQVSGWFKDSERRRSDRPKKLRLTEEQIRLVAEKDSAESDIDDEEGNNAYGLTYHMAAGLEDVGTDVEFISAEYSHADRGTQNVSLDDLRVNTYSFTDVNEEERVMGERDGMNIPVAQSRDEFAAEVSSNVIELTGSELAHSENFISMEFGLNTQSFVLQQESDVDPINCRSFVSQQGSDVNTQSFVPQQGSDVNTRSFVSQQGSDVNTQSFVLQQGSDISTQSFVSQQGSDVDTQSFVLQQGSDVDTQSFVLQQGSDVDTQSFVLQQGSDVDTQSFVLQKGSDVDTVNIHSFVPQQQSGDNTQSFVSQESDANSQAFVSPQEGSTGFNKEAFVSQQGSGLTTDIFVSPDRSGFGSQSFVSQENNLKTQVLDSQGRGTVTHISAELSDSMQSIADSGNFLSNFQTMESSVSQYHAQADVESTLNSSSHKNRSPVIQNEQLKTQSPAFLMSRKFSVPAPKVPQMFTVKATKDECTVVSVNEPNSVPTPQVPQTFAAQVPQDQRMLVSMNKPAQNFPDTYPYDTVSGDADIRSRQQPLSPHCQPSIQVEVPIGFGPCPDGSPSLTISVKTRDGKNVLLEDAPHDSV